MKRLKNSAAAALALIIAVFSGCSPSDTEAVTLTEPTVAEVSEHPLETVAPESGYEEASFAGISGYKKVLLGSDRAAKLKMGYKCLKTQNQRDFYDRIDRSVMSVSKEISSNGFHYIRQAVIDNCLFTESELRLIITAFTEDHPEIFWITDIFGYTSSSEQTVLQLYSNYSVEEIQEKISEIDKVTESFAAEFPSGLSDYERETKIHNLLLDRCEYADGVTDINDDFDAFGIYGALVNKKAVCEGYSRAFQWLLSLSGIESINVIGNESDSLHMWNAVKLNGKWYYADPTWNDGSPYIRYDYYNLTTEELEKYNHTTAPLYSRLSDEQICGIGQDPVSFNLFVPYCNSSDDSYIKQSVVNIRGFSEYNINLIVQRLYKAMKNNEPFIEICINVPETEYSDAVDRLTNGKDGLIFDCIKSANDMYFGKQIDKDHISVIKKEGRSLLTVILSYD